MWKIIDEKSYLAKNLYNEANYMIRQNFFETKQVIAYKDMDKIFQKSENYKKLGSQAGQQTLRLLDKNWKSFLKGIKKYEKLKGASFLGKPNIPKYKKKDGRSIVMIKNIQCRIRDGTIYFSWKPLNSFSGIKTKVSGKLMQIRFVPCGGCYNMELVYETDIPETKQHNHLIAGIDLGVNNFVTMGNNIGIKPIVIKGGVIKSMNQYYNKKLASMRAGTNMAWNNRMQHLTDKRRNKLDTYMHKISKSVVQYCKENNIDTLVIGKTNEWKQNINMGTTNNQNFVYIPYNKFIDQLKYKCENVGIRFIETEESFTSTTSFLDNESPIEKNSNKKRRIKRGLFKSNNGIFINADLNAAYQIIKKVFPSAFGEGNRGCDLHPVSVKI